MKSSITIIIPAYNEEKNLADAVKSSKEALKGLFDDYEIIIFDDGSKDKTGLIADGLVKKDKKIKVIHNPKNMGLGYNYKEGVRLANKDYITWNPGDNENTTKGMRLVMQKTSKADIIISYPVNPKIRLIFRRIISKTFVIFMNVLMDLNLKYYTGSTIYKSELIKNTKITTHSFAFQVEILVRLLKSGHSYIEVSAGETRRRTDTNIFKIKNLIGVFKTVLCLFWDIKIKNRKLYNKKPLRVEE